MYITDSPLLPGDIKKLLLSGHDLVVSGRPLNLWQADRKEFHFYDCAEVIDMEFIPSLVSVTTIDPILNPHLGAIYTGIYITISGENPGTKDEYRFGIRDELGFCLRAAATHLKPHA